MRQIYLPFLIAFISLLPVRAADWPAWRGPNRTGISKDIGLLKTWPKEGPKLLWSIDTLGQAYAAPAVVGDRIYILGSKESKELLFALDVKSGKEMWSVEIGDYYDNRWGGGPRSTPTVDGEFVYALAAKGNLVCLGAAKGNIVWTVNMVSDLGGSLATWGYTESPLIDGDMVICTPGGRQGTLAALDKKTGKVIWRSKAWTDRADYSSVVSSDAQKTHQYVQMASNSIGGVDAKTGKLLWKFARSQRITIPTPITFDDYVYVTSGYGVGCNLLHLTSATEVKEVYANTNMVNHHGGVILLEGYIYGYSDTRGWICQNVKDGEIVWSSRKLAKGSIAFADGKFFCYAETDGTLAVIEASSKEWKELARFQIPKRSSLPKPPNRPRDNVWAHPVIANGKLYLRDRELLFCYDISAGNR